MADHETVIVCVLQIFLKVAEDNGVDTEVPSGEDGPSLSVPQSSSGAPEEQLCSPEVVAQSLSLAFGFRWYASCSEEEEGPCLWRRRPSELSEAFNRRR